MKFDEIYLSQVELLLEVLPLINQFSCFALKGGTAINLFIMNMPRLSVDIDLAYIPIETRELFLENIHLEITKLSDLIKSNGHNVQLIAPSKKLIISNDDARIKIEPNLVIRGGVFPCEENVLCKRAQDHFFKYFKVNTLSKPDLYGGKICAALDRKHPRDLFDIKYLFQENGLTESIRQAFVVYLASSPRPIDTLLKTKIDVIEFKKIYKATFLGMSDIEITADELVEIYFLLTNHINNNLTDNEREFLISIQLGYPDWSLLPIVGIDRLPALNWKILNVKKMVEEKRKKAMEDLKKILNL